MDNERIFEFINPNENDQLSKIRGHDLQDLLILLDEYYLKLRDSLGIDNKITFGLEIEFENVDVYHVIKELEKLFPHNEWDTSSDISLVRGLEIQSPILRDNKRTWQTLNTVCDVIKQYGEISRKSGSHVHVGSQILDRNPRTWLNFLRLWSVYENILFRFSYGSFLTGRPRIIEYAKPMSKEFWEWYEFFEENKSIIEIIIKNLSFRKNQAVSFTKVCYSYSDVCRKNNTIEFRSPNGTLEPIIWQNNINVFVKMLLACKDFKYDDIVTKRHQEISNQYDNLKWYDEIFIDQALEFCDMIFTNNLDKLYFLKQYLKSFEICKRRDDYPNIKTISKKMF